MRPAFSRRATKSAGVQRQYSGTAGRIENCQIGVFLGYASRHGRALIDRALYLPEELGRRRERRRARPAFRRTSPSPPSRSSGRAMLERALAAGVPCAWVTGDSVYGADYALRRCLEARGARLRAGGHQRRSASASCRVEDWLEEVPADGWQRLSAGDGAKGPRLYDWAYLPYPAAPRRGLATRAC